jgi:hypothetical protein
MSYTLRRAHVVIWLVVAMLVPMLLWLSLSDRPTTLYDLSHAPLPAPKGKLIRSTQSGHWQASLRVATDGAQLELSLGQTLPSVGCLVSVLADSLPAVEVGAVRSKGIYRFELPLSVTAAKGLRVRLVDPIQRAAPVTLTF